MRRLTAIASFLLALTGSSTRAGDEEQRTIEFYGVRATVPKGWKVSRQTSLEVIFEKGVSPDGKPEHLIVLLRPTKQIKGFPHTAKGRFDAAIHYMNPEERRSAKMGEKKIGKSGIKAYWIHAINQFRETNDDPKFREDLNFQVGEHVFYLTRARGEESQVFWEIADGLQVVPRR